MFFIIFFVINCKKEQGKGAIVEIGVEIVYKNNLGEYLLDPTIPNHFSLNDMHVYNVQNGKKIERYYPMLDNPRMLAIFKDTTSKPIKYGLDVACEVDTTLLALNQNVTDTIVCSIDKSNGNTIVRKVWYNGVLKWQFADGFCGFIITK